MRKDLPGEVEVAASHFNKERDYWLRQLSGEPVRSQFHKDHHEIDSFIYQPKTVNFSLTGQLFERIMKLANHSDSKLFMILVALVGVILHKYTGHTDVIMGVPVLKQDRDADFINTILPLRIPVQASMSFKELLLNVRKILVDANENQNYPITVLLNQLNLTAEKGEFPLFDISVLLTNIHDKKYLQSIHQNIIFSFSRDTAVIEGLIEYNSYYYSGTTLERIAGHFLNLALEVLFSVEQPIYTLNIISEAEKLRLVSDFNRTELDYPREKTIGEMFAGQVEKTPDQTALVLHNRYALPPWNQHVTYGELDKISNRLARGLRKRGVKPDTLVAIMAERSIEMIAGILGILKAGGAYLPIEPGTPGKRILSMLQDSQTSLLLTHSPLLEQYSFSDLQGLRQSGTRPYVTAPRPPLRDLDQLPIPDRSLIDFEKYTRNISLAMVKNCINLQGTRGCPYHCAYCSKLWPKKHVARSAENIFAEVKRYYDIGIKRFAFIDDIFNLDVENSSRFFALVIQNHLQIQILFPAGLRGDIMTREYIDLMVKAGTIHIAVALETASPRLQKVIRKNLNIGKLRENLEYICNTYPHVILDLFTMHGLPTETEEEAGMTLEFIKNLKWLHFPLINIMKIYPNTEMEQLAIDSGVSRESILEAENLAWHEFSDTLPFERAFTVKYQADFLNDYFLLKERLLHVLPHQMRALTEDEILQKYNSYLPVHLECFDDLLKFVGISSGELESDHCLDPGVYAVPHWHEKIRQTFPREVPAKDALRVLLLDLSLSYSRDSRQLEELYEAPLGLMYLLTYLNRRFGSSIHGKIAKSRIDFDSHQQLKSLLETFKPHIIGIRTLTFYKDFFHRTISRIRQWGITTPIIAGGPYATSGYLSMLQDQNIDLAVLGEGEVTLAELVEQILRDNGRWPDQQTLAAIKGIALCPGDKAREKQTAAREIIVMDPLPGLFPWEGNDGPEPCNHPNDLAYMLFTSGSTGKPKGVMMEHWNVGNLVAGLRQRIYRDYPANQRVSLLAPYVFDASVQQIFGILLQGHQLYIVPEEIRLDVERLVAYFQENGIQVTDGTPTHLRLFLENAANTGVLPGVKHCLIGGEALLKNEVERFFKCYDREIPGITNLYGPTECCVDSITFEVTRESLHRFDSIPIGMPMPNEQVYIIDQCNQLKPIGAAGELCLSGRGVSRGYLNNPELTAEKFCLRRLGGLFLKTPSREASGPPCKNFLLKGAGKILSKFPVQPCIQASILIRLYRTGDLARWLPDGNIEFCGRIDHQVKVRGYRIELGEIENQLQRLEAVKQAVVTVKEDENGDKYLCAYLVPIQGNSPAKDNSLDVQALKDQLSRQLPDYMIPLFFITLESIPLTTSGKVDRKSLPEPDIAAIAQSYVPPTDGVEKKLVDIWADLLGKDKKIIGIDTHFFELGGHSLKATILMSRISKEFQTRVPLIEIFKTPTIRHLARFIRSGKKFTDATGGSPVVLLKKGNSEALHLFFVHDGSGEVDGYMDFCRHLPGPFNYWGIRVQLPGTTGAHGELAPRRLELETLARLYIDEIRKLQPHGPYYIAGWSLGGTTAFEMTRQLEQQQETVALLAIIDAYAPLPPVKQTTAGKNKDFSFESELKWVRTYLPTIEKEINLTGNPTPGEFWQSVTEFLGKTGIDPEVIRKIMNKYEALLIPNYEQLSTVELLALMNRSRSLVRARETYIPPNKIKTPIHFFAATDSAITDGDRWADFTSGEIKIYPVSGNHFSIFQEPQAREFSAIFSNLLENRKHQDKPSG